MEKTGPGETSGQSKGWRDLGQGVGAFTIGVVVSLGVSHGHLPPPSVAQHVAAYRQSGALSLVQILEILCSDWLNHTMLGTF